VKQGIKYLDAISVCVISQIFCIAAVYNVDQNAAVQKVKKLFQYNKTDR